MTDITVEGTFAKVDPDRREVFGWASITEMNGSPVIDLQGDLIDTSELEKAAYTYVLESRVGGEMHQRVGKSAPKQVGTLIESFVITPEKIEKMGLPGDTIPSGWWIGFKVNDDNVWKAVKGGKYTGFSIHGKGLRKEIGQIGKSMSDIREELLQSAFAHAEDEASFVKNLAAIADELYERDHVEAHYFGEVVKHLIGRHDQKDHDPTKGKHKRGEHRELSRQARGGSKEASENLYPGGMKSMMLDNLGAGLVGSGAALAGVAALRGRVNPDVLRRAALKNRQRQTRRRRRAEIRADESPRPFYPGAGWNS